MAQLTLSHATTQWFKNTVGDHPQQTDTTCTPPEQTSSSAPPIFGSNQALHVGRVKFCWELLFLSCAQQLQSQPYCDPPQSVEAHVWECMGLFAEQRNQTVSMLWEKGWGRRVGACGILSPQRSCPSLTHTVLFFFPTLRQMYVFISYSKHKALPSTEHWTNKLWARWQQSTQAPQTEEQTQPRTRTACQSVYLGPYKCQWEAKDKCSSGYFPHFNYGKGNDTVMWPRSDLRPWVSYIMKISSAATASAV